MLVFDVIIKYKDIVKWTGRKGSGCTRQTHHYDGKLHTTCNFSHISAKFLFFRSYQLPKDSDIY